MRLKTSLFLMFPCISLYDISAQVDSAVQLLQKVSVKYLNNTEKMAGQYGCCCSGGSIGFRQNNKNEF